MSGIVYRKNGNNISLTGTQYVNPATGTMRLCVRDANGNIVKYGFTTNTSASQYSPAFYINGRRCNIGINGHIYVCATITNKFNYTRYSYSCKYTMSNGRTHSYNGTSTIKTSDNYYNDNIESTYTTIMELSNTVNATSSITTNVRYQSSKGNATRRYTTSRTGTIYFRAKTSSTWTSLYNSTYSLFSVTSSISSKDYWYDSPTNLHHSGSGIYNTRTYTTTMQLKLGVYSTEYGRGSNFGYDHDDHYASSIIYSTSSSITEGGIVTLTETYNSGNINL